MSDMDEVLEYLFFTRKVADSFIEKLSTLNLTYTEEVESVEGAILLKVPEGVTDEIWDELDDLFDVLSVEDQALLEEGADDEDAKSAAGVYLQLVDGRQTIAPVDPEIMNRILSVVSMDEFNAFVDTIVKSVEQPDDSAICQR